MTDYFSSVNIKSTLKKTDDFSEEYQPHLLKEHYKLVRENRLTSDKVKEIKEFYLKCYDLLLLNFSIIVQGPQSKFTLLETFKARYLSCKTEHPLNNATVVRFHGLDPVKMDDFAHNMFGLTSYTPKHIQQGIDSFVTKTSKTPKKTFIFLIHSFDHFLRDSEDIVDVIATLRAKLPKQIQVLASSDVINASVKLSDLKFRLNLIFLSAPFTESFIHERAQLIDEFDFGTNENNALLANTMNLQTLKDVHQALGNSGQIMLIILKSFVDSKENIDFRDLQRTCENRFLVRRAAALRQHLSELVDHKLIEVDGTQIKCLVDEKTCIKFIEYAEAQTNE